MAEFWHPEIETMPLEQMRARQEKMVVDHVAHAYKNSPYYRKKFDEIGLKPEDIKNIGDFFTKVPFISKSEIIDAQRENPPFGEFLASPEDEIVRLWVSPGPIFYPFSGEDLAAFQDMCSEAFFATGIRKHDLLDIAFSYYWVPAGTIMDDACRAIGAGVIPGGTGMTDMHIDVMKSAGVSAYLGTPSFLMHIADVAKSKNIDLSLRVGVFTAEPLPSDLKKSLEDAFGLDARQLYGTADVGFIGRECEIGGGMHLYEDMVVEIIDPNTGEHVPLGEPGEVVATLLNRKCMPLLRYRTGDLVQGLDEEPCACGRTSPKLLKLIGRTGDTVKVRGIFLVPKQVGDVVNSHNDLGNFQIILEREDVRDEITIKIEYSGKDPQTIIGQLQKEFKERVKLQVDVELIDQLPEDSKLLDDRRDLFK